MNKKQLNELSKYLCFILRHSPAEIGEPHEIMDNHGWVDIKVLIDGVNDKGKYHLTYDILKQIVSEDKKGRYCFNADNTKIKCCQGHSVEWVEVELTYKEPPKFLYHGTNTTALSKILKSGHISKMKRHAVHMVDDVVKAMKSAERWGLVPVVIKINALELYSRGVKFGVSENGVWCAEDIPVWAIDDCIY